MGLIGYLFSQQWIANFALHLFPAAQAAQHNNNVQAALMPLILITQY
jgi:hypothetical protein